MNRATSPCQPEADAVRTWGEAMALLHSARADLEDSNPDCDAFYGAAEHAATMRLVETPFPDWRAFVAKLEAACLNDDELVDGTLPLLIADARRLAGLPV